MIKCFFCNKPSVRVKFMIIPGHIIVPNKYFTCENHEENWLKFEDVYNEDGTRNKYESK